MRDKNWLKMGLEERLISSVTTLRIQSQVLEFICLLAEHFLNISDLYNNDSLHQAQINLAHKAAYLLELHSDERLHIHELARELDVRHSYLSKCFKCVYGIIPKEYYIKMRISAAKELLQNTDLSAEKISGIVHFSSPAHFCKFFNHKVGCSSLKYRNKKRDEMAMSQTIATGAMNN